VVEAAPKTPRNRWDLPLGAIAITAACVNAMVVGSLAHQEGPAFGGVVDTVQSSNDRFVVADDRPVLDYAVGIGIVPVKDERVGDQGGGDFVRDAPVVDHLGDTGMIGMLAQYQGDGRVTAPWAPGVDNGTMYGTAVGEAWGVGGVALSGIGEGGGGTAHCDLPIVRLPTLTGTGVGVGHGHLTGQHIVKNVCTLRFVEPVASDHIPAETIRRVVHENEGRFRACYLDGLKRSPTLAGRVVTKFVIARDGTVATAADAGSDLADEGVRTCVQRAFSKLEFPSNPDGIATVTYPIVMSPAE
jgi:hypothetical protein